MIIVLLNERSWGRGVASVHSTNKTRSNGARNHSYHKRIFISDEPNVHMLAIDNETRSLKIVSFRHSYTKNRQIIFIWIVFVRLFYQTMGRENFFFSFSSGFSFVLSFWFPLEFNQKKDLYSACRFDKNPISEGKICWASPGIKTLRRPCVGCICLNVLHESFNWSSLPCSRTTSHIQRQWTTDLQ